MVIVLVWWLWMEVIGLAALPLAYRFFRPLPDRGIVFARPLGLLLGTYLLWLGGSLGLLRNSLGGALLCLVAVALASWYAYRRGRAPDDPGLWAWLKSNRRLLLAVELLFAGALALWSLLRAYSPEITTAGGEKFMELMYLNSIGRSDYFPPHDAWLGGYAISYYYFGYVMIALLTRLSGFAAHQTFNVAVALLFALTCTGAFSLVYNLVRGLGPEGGREGAAASAYRAARRFPSILAGFLGATFVAVLGNLEGFLESLYALRLLPQVFWRWLDIQELNRPFNLAAAPSLMPTRSGWWWWRASRVINDLDPLGQPMGIEPIDEFPGFSFLLGDMHPHVLALPFVLLALAVALRALLHEPQPAAMPGKWWGPLRRVPLLVPLCLGALGFLNTWDFPIYLCVFFLAYGLGKWRQEGAWSRSLAADLGLTAAAVTGLGFALYLPFYVGFQSQAGGILPTLYVGTRFRQYAVMFAPFLVAVTALLAVLTVQWSPRLGARRLLAGGLYRSAAFLLVPLVAMLLVALSMLLTEQGRQALEEIRRVPFIQAIVGDDPWLRVLGRLLGVKARTWVMPVLVAVMAGLGACLLQKTAAHRRGQLGLHPSLQFLLLCAVVGLLLTLSVEFVYLVDVFRVRMNTIFKFYFQAWVLMGIASAVAVSWLIRQKGWLPVLFAASTAILVLLGMVYPVLANISRAGAFATAPNLDGTAYLATSQPDDYAAIEWLNREVAGAPLILEAPGTGGSSYVYEGRVSALTGLPTLLGWPGHENQWRGSYDIQSAREPDIRTLYNTPDPQTALDLLAKYGVQYVYVGPAERSLYERRGLDKFDRIMERVYQNEGVMIYRVRE